MRWWILNTNLEAYKNLCEAERTDPMIIEQKDDKTLVGMTSQMESTWVMCGYWYEFG
jgi:hypothetical protein